MKAIHGIMIVLMMIFLSINATAEVKRVVGYQTYIGLSSDTKPTTADEGSIFTETDTGKKWIWNGTTWVVQAITAVQDTVTYRAPGYTDPISVKGFQKVTWYFNIGSINTSVAMALLSKKGAGAWTAVRTDSTVYLSNGAYGLTWTNAATADSIKGRWIYEVGGSDALITSVFGLSGGN
jgi:hypothetical protein